MQFQENHEENLDHGLVAACDRTGTFVSASPLPANATMMQPQNLVEQQRQQQRHEQRMADRDQQQQFAHGEHYSRCDDDPSARPN